MILALKTRKNIRVPSKKFLIIKRFPSGLLGTAYHFGRNSLQISRGFATIARRLGLVDKFHTTFGVNISNDSGAVEHHTLIQGDSSATLTSNPAPQETDGTPIPTFRLSPTKYVQDGSLKSFESQFVIFSRFADYHLRNHAPNTFKNISDSDEGLLAHLLDLYDNHKNEFNILEQKIKVIEKMPIPEKTKSTMARIESENFVKSIYSDYAV